MYKKLQEQTLNYIKYMRKYVRDFTILAVISFIVYLPFMSGQLNNADGFTFGVFYHGEGYGTERNLGRFFLEIFDFWRDGMVLPALIVAVGLLFMLFGCVLLWDMLHISDSVVRVLLGILLIAAPSVADLFTYYYTADDYCFAFFLSILAAYLLAEGKGKASVIGAASCIFIALGFYQTYFGMTVTASALWLLWYIPSENITMKQVWQKVCRFLMGGVAGIASYGILMEILKKIKFMVPLGARGVDNVVGNMLGNIVFSIAHCYQVFVEYFFTDRILLNSWHLKRYFNIMIFLWTMLFMVLIIVQRKLYKQAGKLILWLVIVALYPLMLSLILVMAPDSNVYAETGILILGYMNFFYVLFLLFMTMVRKQGLAKGFGYAWIIYIAMLTCVFVGVFERTVQAEQSQFQALAYQMEQRLEADPEYASGMKVMVSGRPQSGNYPVTDSMYQSITKGMISQYSLTFGAEDQVSHSWIDLFKYYCGVHYTECTKEERAAIRTMEAYDQMGIFPAENSVKRIGDTMVIRLSVEEYDK